MRFFNTSGPVDPSEHYCIPPLERIDLAKVMGLIGQRRYFVLHAPRQTGKTSMLLALMDELNCSGHYRCVYINVESGQAAREDVGAAMRAMLNHMALQAQWVLDDQLVAQIWPEVLERAGPFNALEEVLSRWAQAQECPLVLLVDEIDSLIGDTLLAVLRQLRAGHHRRPRRFPQSIVLCGVRDVRDYRIHSMREGGLVAGGSAFNIKAASLRLGDFSQDETQALFAQHNADTGQVWPAETLRLIWDLTQGQPWLVNALGHEIDDGGGNADRSLPVSLERLQEAKEQLILRRETHLDQLGDKLLEERVRRVVEPLLVGWMPTGGLPPDDIDYVRDLGLIAEDSPVRIANPIYREVVPRQLVYADEGFIDQETAWYVDAKTGRLGGEALLAAFQQFFRQHSEHWMQGLQYKEAGPQLLLQAFLQRIVNGGGRVEREYGLGRGRTDLLIVWPMRDAGRSPVHHQQIVIECKVLRGNLERTLRQGVAQTRAYMDRCGAQEGHLILFDPDPDKPWRDKLFKRRETAGGAAVALWGM